MSTAKDNTRVTNRYATNSQIHLPPGSGGSRLGWFLWKLRDTAAWADETEADRVSRRKQFLARMKWALSKP